MRNDQLSITLDPATAALEVRDLRAGIDWRQVISGDAFRVDASELRRGPGHQELVADLAGAAPLRMSLILPDAASDVLLTLYAPQPLPMEKAIAYPYSFTAPRATGELALPYQEGILLKLDDPKPLDFAEDLFSLAGWPPGGLSMPWFGFVNKGAGVLTIVETPFDVDLRLKWVDDALAGQLEWVASFGEWRYPRQVRWCFAAQGGHVALAKRYREHVMGLGRFRSLREKAQVNPALERFIGSPQIWPNGDLVSPEFLQELSAAGVERATIMLANRVEDEAARALLEEAHRHGYLLGRYDNYNLTGKEEWSYRADLDAAKLPDGSFLQRDPRKVLTCGRQAFERALLQQPADLAQVRYDVQFMDTLLSQRLRECWDPAHPCSREQDALYRRQIMALGSRMFHQVTGSEDGIDYAFDQTDYLEGPMTLHRFIDKGLRSTVWEETSASAPAARKARRKAEPKAEPQAESQAAGRTQRPAKDFKLVPVAPGEIVLNYGLNEAHRAPLLELVYHDSVSTTYHWRWSNMKIRDLWWKADLFNVLYGTRPMWFIDREIWDDNRERMTQSYRQVCGWHARVGWDEMLSHDYLTPDRRVQRTTWSSGVAVVANFGDEPYAMEGGRRVEPRSFLVIEP
ncbi:MAG: hypothetical protein NTW86_29755 [Candidatus Sumerlaeota bacterium]|nr:hypothetical protein [Candidatus Sumerlaeota bacterium]